MKALVAFTLLVCAIATAAAQSSNTPPIKRGNAGQGKLRVSPPLPIAIPEELSPPQEAYAAFPETPADGAATIPAAPSACQLRLTQIAAFHPLPMLVGPGECGATDAVLLNTVILPDQTKVTLAPPATLRCSMAEQVAHWVREDVAPDAVKLGSALRGLDNFDSYECRGRNRVRGAKLSEHGRANALDVRGFKLADGRTIGLTDMKVDKDWRGGIRASVCARFSTVLGPGSDGAHEEHIHLDLAERRGGYKICEWDVRAPVVEARVPAESAAATEQGTASAPPPDQVPLPRPRPTAANAARHGSGLLRNSFRN